MGKALGKHIINLYSSGISRLVKIRDVEKLQQDIENDLVIKDQMPSKKRRAQKAKIKEELMSIARQPSRYWDWCVPEDEKQEIEKLWSQT